MRLCRRIAKGFQPSSSGTLSPSTTAEAGAVTLNATWSDVCANFHSAQIHWGDGVKTDLDLGQTASGSFSASHVYGDNGIYNVTIEVSDEDDTAATTLAHAVLNELPAVVLDTSGVVVLPGGAAFLGRLGHSQDHAASGDDVGSDDLRFTWTTDDQVFPATDVFGDTTYFNDGVGPDPFPSSQGVFPFHADDVASVLFDAPGVYIVTVQLGDDDGGSDAQASSKLVSGDDSCTRSVGLWREQFASTGAQQADDETLIRYLHYVEFASTYFAEVRSLGTLGDASAILQPGGADVGEAHPSNRRGKAVSALLAAWLNVASGSVPMLGALEEREPTGPTVLTTLHQMEQVLADPNSSVADHLEANRTLDLINNRGCTTPTN